MHEIRVSIVSPEAADHGVAELWAAGKLIGYTILEDTDLMLRIEPRTRPNARRRRRAQPRASNQSSRAPTRAVLTPVVAGAAIHRAGPAFRRLATADK